VSDRQELVRTAFAALDAGDVAPFRSLLSPDAKWVGIPQGDATPVCANRDAIIDRLRRVRKNGRRFSVGKLIEQDDRIAVEVSVLAAEWSGPVTLFRVMSSCD
jgi:ketosteroid isomerase-like protein